MAVTTHFMEDQAPGLSQWIVHEDFTKWHVVSVRWTSTRLSYFVDGIRVLVETDPDRIPQTAMWPAFQTHVHRDADGDLPELIPGQRAIRMQVDWLRVYERA
jgi:beta-glucanase (GH16 family)